MNTEHHMARMDRPAQVPAANSDARKRDRAARSQTLTDCAQLLRHAIEHLDGRGLDDRDAGYVEGWNASARYFAAAFDAAAGALS